MLTAISFQTETEKTNRESQNLRKNYCLWVTAVTDTKIIHHLWRFSRNFWTHSCHNFREETWAMKGPKVVSSDGDITEIKFNQGNPNNLFLFLQLLVNFISVTWGDYFSLLIPFSVHALHLPCGASPNVTETINGVYLTHILTVCSFSGRLNIIERLQHLFWCVSV